MLPPPVWAADLGCLQHMEPENKELRIRARRQNSVPMVAALPALPYGSVTVTQTDVNFINEKLLEPLKISLLKT